MNKNNQNKETTRGTGKIAYGLLSSKMGHHQFHLTVKAFWDRQLP
jgi:hypothetical protein